MSMKSGATTSGYFGKSGVTTEPMSLACWVKLHSITSDPAFLSVMYVRHNSPSDFSTNSITLRRNGSTYTIRAFSQNSTGVTAAWAESGSFSLDTWVHVAATFGSHSRRRIYLDGTKTEDTASCTTSSPLEDYGIGPGATGIEVDLAEAAIWNSELSDAEVTQLASGSRPDLIDNANLKMYVPLVSGVEFINPLGLEAGTKSGTPGHGEGHPPIIGPILA